MKPTSEQIDAQNKFDTGESLKICAFAGSGKSTTLKKLAESSLADGLYIAFNRSTAIEAKSKFPDTVKCQTIHSLALGATATAFKRSKGKLFGSLNAKVISSFLNLQPLVISKGFGLAAQTQGFWILQTLKNFMHGDRTQIGLDDVYLTGLIAAHLPQVIAQVRQLLLGQAQHVWARMTDPADPLPLGYDGYLKLWALSQPAIPATFILFDEAQDANPVILEVLRRQSHAQIVYVGDRYQQLYGFRGAVNAMQHISTVHTSYLTQSFRFGPAIAGVATTLLSHLGEQRPVVGTPSIDSKLGCVDPNAILCRTNAGVIENSLRSLRSGRSFHVVGGVSEQIQMLQGVSDLKQGKPSGLTEFFGCENWEQVKALAGLPEGEHLKTFVGIVETHGEEPLIEMLMKSTDTEEKASRILSTVHKAKGREWDRVRLADDYFPPKKDKTGRLAMPAEEIQILYVAVTRARLEVQMPERLATFFKISQPMQTGTQKSLSLTANTKAVGGLRGPGSLQSTPPPILPKPASSPRMSVVKQLPKRVHAPPPLKVESGIYQKTRAAIVRWLGL